MLPKILGINSYALMVVVGLAAAFVLALVRRKVYGYKITNIVYMLCASIVGMIVGGRLLFIITEIPALINHGFSSEILVKRVLNGGLVFYGGLVGALLAVVICAKIVKDSPKRAVNFAIPCFTAFHCFGRIGCLLEGCCYGIPAANGITLVGETVKRVPTQLIEAIALLMITAILLLLESDYFKKQPDFSLLPTYALLYAPIRFIIEFWRGDVLRGVYALTLDYKTTDGGFVWTFSLSTSQIISLIIIVGTLLFCLYRHLLNRQAARLTIQSEADKTDEKDEPTEE